MFDKTMARVYGSIPKMFIELNQLIRKRCVFHLAVAKLNKFFHMNLYHGRIAMLIGKTGDYPVVESVTIPTLFILSISFKQSSLSICYCSKWKSVVCLISQLLSNLFLKYQKILSPTLNSTFTFWWKTSLKPHVNVDPSVIFFTLFLSDRNQEFFEPQSKFSKYKHCL